MERKVTGWYINSENSVGLPSPVMINLIVAMHSIIIMKAENRLFKEG